MSTDSTEQHVLITTLEANNGRVGVLELNSEKTLNSLTLDMVRTIHRQLVAWQQDDDIALVVLSGEGEKAFCAGGDVQQLYRSAIEKPGGPCTYGESFFLEEYCLNYLIHSYSKPLLCLGHGVVMGGGLGLMAGASHRVVTEKTRIAMPEITIGLFPDVGGTWFLSKMPRALGVFFALTGASINASDALFTHLADYVVSHQNRAQVLEAIIQQEWTHNTNENNARLSALLSELSLTPLELQQAADSELGPCMPMLETACQQTCLGEVMSALRKIDNKTKWLEKAISTMDAGSPLSSLIIYEQLRRHRYADLQRVFISEYQLATNVIRYPEFAEGVRALLIDKDKSPKWQFDHFSAVPASLLEHFFSAPWETNPIIEKLGALG